ncbi:chitotriosidase-1-like [Pomacea canaliculata]|uniref:chitotriosidase-1-like n=1 Tax=Pomacea canaliculata TaxID=400727 RepID=UPI000D73FE0A|nr:chitotriosidase-1-like [Pomacea canaliculata]
MARLLQILESLCHRGIRARFNGARGNKLMFQIPRGREFLRVCYFTNWSNGRASMYSRFSIQNIDPTLCSHLIYAFAKVDPDSRSIIPMEADEDAGLTMPAGRGRLFAEFNDLKKNYPHLVTLLSIGGETASREAFVDVTSDNDMLSRFAKTSVDFLRKRQFDDLRGAFNDDKTGDRKLLLTAALPAGKETIDDGFEVESFSR